MTHRLFSSLLPVLLAFVFGPPVPARPAKPAPKAARAPPAVAPDPIKGLEFRNIGPAIMGGRIDDFAVVESDPATFYVVLFEVDQQIFDAPPS